MKTGEKGRLGEESAIEFLAKAGYRVLARNVRLGGGEIDVICLDAKTLVFVEVKRRDAKAFGSAISAVDAHKRARIRKLAAEYAQVVAPETRFRFDIVAIDGNRVTLHRNAF